MLCLWCWCVRRAAGSGQETGHLRARLSECVSEDRGPGVSWPGWGCEWAGPGSPRAWVPLCQSGVSLHLSCPQQAGFLITNALRFVLNAPGVTSWQYTLLQLQVRPALPSVVLLSFPHGALSVPPSLRAAQRSLQPQLRRPASRPPFLPRTAAPFHSGSGLRPGKPFLCPCPSRAPCRACSEVCSSPGEWRPAHPAPALSGPLGSGNGLWRSPCPGPDEQGLPQLPGRCSKASGGQQEQKGGIGCAH